MAHKWIGSLLAAATMLAPVVPAFAASDTGIRAQVNERIILAQRADWQDRRAQRDDRSVRREARRDRQRDEHRGDRQEYRGDGYDSRRDDRRDRRQDRRDARGEHREDHRDLNREHRREHREYKRRGTSPGEHRDDHRDLRREHRSDHRDYRRDDRSSVAITRRIATIAIAGSTSAFRSARCSMATATRSTIRGSIACRPLATPIAGCAITTTRCSSTRAAAASST